MRKKYRQSIIKAFRRGSKSMSKLCESLNSKTKQMNIYAPQGTKVTVTEESIENGYSHHTDIAKKHLVVGNTYTVNHTEVNGWHTDVYLEEFPDIAFNSATFD